MTNIDKACLLKCAPLLYFSSEHWELPIPLAKRCCLLATSTSLGGTLDGDQQLHPKVGDQFVELRVCFVLVLGRNWTAEILQSCWSRQIVWHLRRKVRNMAGNFTKHGEVLKAKKFAKWLPCPLNHPWWDAKKYLFLFSPFQWSGTDTLSQSGLDKIWGLSFFRSGVPCSAHGF